MALLEPILVCLRQDDVSSGRLVVPEERRKGGDARVDQEAAEQPVHHGTAQHFGPYDAS